MNMKIALALMAVMAMMRASAQANDDPTRQYIGRAAAGAFLASALSGAAFNAADGRELVPDGETAAAVAEAVLFPVYGEEKIRSERPYEIHRIGDYWLVFGTLPERWLGGTFKVVLEAQTARILLLSHDK